MNAYDACDAAEVRRQRKTDVPAICGDIPTWRSLPPVWPETPGAAGAATANLLLAPLVWLMRLIPRPGAG